MTNVETCFGTLHLLVLPGLPKERAWLVASENLAMMADELVKKFSLGHTADALPCSTREDCTPPGRDAH